MPKVYTYNAEFNPISFADRIAPMRLYKEEYDKQQAAYEKLLEETNDLGVLKDVAMDANSYKTYEDFTNEIASVADEMRTKGLSQDVRNKLLDLKRRQSTEISPLLDKQKKRADLIAEQRKYREAHQNSIFDTDYDEVALENITGDSTFRPYDLDDNLDKTTKMIYSNIMSNDGVDNTDYDKIKSQLGYDNLSPKKQTVIDNMIGLAQTMASSTYKIYKDKEAMDRYRYGNKNTRSSDSSTVQSKQISYGDMLDAKNKKTNNATIGDISVPVLTSNNGQKYLKDYKNVQKAIEVPQKKDGETKEQYNERAFKAIAKAYYGHNLEGSISTNAGEKIIVLRGDNGQYYIIDNKNNIKPISNINSFREIATVYRNKPVRYENGVNAMLDNNGQPYEKKDTDTLDTSSPVKVYSTLFDTEGDDDILNFFNELEINEEDYASLFNDGFSIYKYKITNKRGSVVGYQYVIKSNSTPTTQQQSQQPNQQSEEDVEETFDE